MKTFGQVVQVRPYYLKELAALYQVSPYTMRKWIRSHQGSIGHKIGKLFTALQVYTIFEKLGLPGEIQD